MKNKIVLLLCSLMLILISFYPMFSIVREYIFEKVNSLKYDIKHAYNTQEELDAMIENRSITFHENTIKIKEEDTGLKAPLTNRDKDEGVQPGNIVKIHILVNDKEISSADEIWLSNRDRGSRYFSWLDILEVEDKLTSERYIKIVQRLTDNNHPMEKREWKVITISDKGEINEERIKYSNRSENKLNVKLINFSNTGLMTIGYYSDINTGWPNLFFPIFYPMFTTLFGCLLLIRVGILYRKSH